MDYKSNYKYCIVPCCKNTTVNTKGKLFLSVPRNITKRKAWTRAMKRDEKMNKELSCLSSLWCCEDHFSLPEDMENYWQWKLTNDVKRIKLKPEVVPHIFDCQKKNPQPSVERTAVKKRRQISLVQDAIMEYDSHYNASNHDYDLKICNKSNDVSTTSTVSPKGYGWSMDYGPLTDEKCVQANLRKPFRSKGTNTCTKIMRSVGCSTSNIDASSETNIAPKKFGQALVKRHYPNCVSNTKDFSPPDVKKEFKSGVFSHALACQKNNVQLHLVQDAFIDCSLSQYDARTNIDFDDPSTSAISPESIMSIDYDSDTGGKYVQVNFKKSCRSTGTNTCTTMKSVGCSTSDLDVNARTNTSFKMLNCEIKEQLYQNFVSNTCNFDSSEGEESSENFSSGDEDIQKQKFNDNMVVGTVMLNEKEPRLYLGLPKKKNHCLLLLHYCNS